MNIIKEPSYPIRPTVCEIDLAALRNNLFILRRKAGNACKIMAVVKADAYGHGATEVAKLLEDENVDFFAVAILEEALRLRSDGIKTPIIILGGILDGQEGAIFDYDLTPMVFSLESMRRIEEEGRRRGISRKVHVKIDTGMGRLGIQPEEVKGFFSEIGAMENIELEGVATHFSCADFTPGSEEAAFTRLQIERFKECIAGIESLGFHIPLIHTANSAAILNFPDSIFNLVRPGIMLYGSYPSPLVERIEGLKGVMSFKTKIIDLKDVDEGFGLSYGRTYITSARQRIAVIPVGYADGYRRELSNKGVALVRGKRAGVAGKVCMDMTMLDVTGIKGAQNGDEVYLFGGEGTDVISIDEFAEAVGTIPYEVMCGISQRVPRVYLDKEE
ncbi:MAG: alanine racemase [bacterium]|nr:alanine racemase [bacterium]